eukprot:7518837-Karenia_brevis.AAC.1
MSGLQEKAEERELEEDEEAAERKCEGKEYRKALFKDMRGGEVEENKKQEDEAKEREKQLDCIFSEILGEDKKKREAKETRSQKLLD